MKNLLFLLLSILIISCKEEVKKEENSSPSVQETKTIKDPKNPIPEKTTITNDSLIGIYTGFFEASVYNETKRPSYSNKITISIDAIKNDSIYGHSIVAGNNRPFKGNFRVSDLKYAAIVFEPGDDKYDGFFKFTFNPTLKYIKGTWIANDSKLAVSERKYELKKKKFNYNKNLNITLIEDGYSESSLSETQYDDRSYKESIDDNNIAKLNASVKKLTNRDIENLNKGELEVLRNLIYARHGYSFKNRKMRYFFDSHIKWYIPVSTDVRNALTDLEKENIALIKRYEEHADKYYDYFGR